MAVIGSFIHVFNVLSVQQSLKNSLAIIQGAHLFQSLRLFESVDIFE